MFIYPTIFKKPYLKHLLLYLNFVKLKFITKHRLKVSKIDLIVQIGKNHFDLNDPNFSLFFFAIFDF